MVYVSYLYTVCQTMASTMRSLNTHHHLHFLNIYLLYPSRLNTLDCVDAGDALPLDVWTGFLPNRDEIDTRPIRLINLLTSGLLAASAPPLIVRRLLIDLDVWSDRRPGVLITAPLARFTGCFSLIVFCVRCNTALVGDNDSDADVVGVDSDDGTPSRAWILLFLFRRILFGRFSGCRDSISRISSSGENETLFSRVSIRFEFSYSSAIIVAAFAGIFFMRITFCLAAVTFVTPTSCNKNGKWFD